MGREEAKIKLRQAYVAYVKSRATGANHEDVVALQENYLRLKCVLPVVSGLSRNDVDEITMSAEEAFAAHF